MTTEALVEVIERLPDRTLVRELEERGYTVKKKDEDED